MPSLVEQLQTEALDQSAAVSDLLRKAKVVATKLELDEFLRWVESELGGYSLNEVPAYRQLWVEPKAWNHFHGWQPLTTSSAELQELISKCPIGQPAPELEELLRTEKSSTLRVPFPPKQETLLLKGMTIETEISRHVDRAQVAGILSAVRNIILDWSLKLEKAGIKGEGMSFKAVEKARVDAARTSYHIDNIEYFMGSIGNVSAQASQSFVQVNIDVDVKGLKDLIGQIKKYKYIDMLDLNNEQKEMLREIIENLDQELSHDTPQPTKLQDIGGSIKRILEGASGNIIASGIMHMLAKLIKGI